MDIRVLNRADAEEYWSLRLKMLKQNPEAFSTSYEQAVQRKNPISQVEKNFSTEGSYTFGAFHQEKLFGAVTLIHESNLKFRHKANIVAMYVRPEMRRLGVGRKLLERAINKAKSLEGIKQLNLMVVTSNERAKNLYQSFGFEIFGTEKNALIVNGKYYDEHYMVLYI